MMDRKKITKTTNMTPLDLLLQVRSDILRNHEGSTKMTDRELLLSIRGEVHRALGLLIDMQWKSPEYFSEVSIIIAELVSTTGRVVGLCDDRIEEDDKVKQ